MPAAASLLRSLLAPILAAGFLLLIAPPSLAANGRWNRFGPAAGGIQALVGDPFAAGTLYAAVLRGNHGDVYRSLDGGASWGWAAVGLPREEAVSALAPDPLRPGTLYAAGEHHLFRSDDRGSRWVQVSGEGYLPARPDGLRRTDTLLAATASRGKTVLYLAGTGRLWQSADGGTSWRSVLASAVRYLTTDSTGAVYAGLLANGEAGDMLRSSDGGASWQRLGSMRWGGAPCTGASTAAPPGARSCSTSHPPSLAPWPSTPRGPGSSMRRACCAPACCIPPSG